ncbi:MAG: hypothetical protein GC154_05700 [bacterium]|nr:hypothetical protein [bacterium]
MRRLLLNETYRDLAVCFLLALLQGAVMIGAELHLDGRPSFPLDDSFIHLQYANQIAHGYYFRYQNTGGVSGGATSFLYPHLLAVGVWLGFTGERLILWAQLIALFSTTAALFFLQRCGRRIGSPFAGWAAVIWTVLNGHMAWAFWSGMEIALFASIFFWTMSEALRERPSFDRLFAAMGLLSLARPEGVVISLAAGAILVLKSMMEGWFFQSLAHRRALASLAFLLVCLIGPPLFYRFALSGSGGNSLVAKSLLYQPIMSFSQRADRILSNFSEMIRFLMAAPSVVPRVGEFMAPGALAFAVAGFTFTALRGVEGRWRCALAALPLLIVLAAVSTLEAWALHNFRYLAPIIPWIMLWGFVGVSRLLSGAAPSASAPAWAVAALAMLIAAPHLPAWASRYARESAVIDRKQRAAAEWISASLPADRPLAINDAGALAFFSRVPVYDLVGLVTNDTTLAYRAGEGALYETLEHLSLDERPRFAMVFPSWFKELSRTFDVFYRPRVAFPDPFDPGFGKKMYEINWFYRGHEDAPRKRTMREEWEVKDRLDVSDLDAERDHDYRIELRDGRFPEVPNPFRRNFGYHEEIDETFPGIENEVRDLIPRLWADGTIYNYDVVDAGRRIDGAESFTLSGLEAGRPAWLILRTCDNAGDRPRFAFRMAVEIDGVYAGEWKVSGTPWNWYETVFPIPAELIENPSIRVRVRNLGEPGFPWFDSYYYWICQSGSNGEKSAVQ